MHDWADEAEKEIGNLENECSMEHLEGILKDRKIKELEDEIHRLEDNIDTAEIKAEMDANAQSCMIQVINTLQK